MEPKQQKVCILILRPKSDFIFIDFIFCQFLFPLALACRFNWKIFLIFGGVA